MDYYVITLLISRSLFAKKKEHDAIGHDEETFDLTFIIYWMLVA